MKKPSKRLAHASETIRPLQVNDLTQVHGGTLTVGTTIISSGTTIISTGTSVISRH